MKMTSEQWEALLDKIRKNNKFLNSLVLDFNDLRDKDVKEFAQALKNNQTLTSLNLAGNSIGDEGGEAIAQALKDNYYLTSLNLKYNRIGNKGGTALAQMLKSHPALTSFDFFSNDLDEEGAKVFLQMLKDNRVLTFLDIARSGSGNEEKKKVASFLTRNQSLHIQLYQAVYSNKLDIVQSFIAQGVSPLSTTGDEQNTPLHWAVLASHVEVTQWLLQEMRTRHLSLTAQNKEGKTAQDLAENKPEILALFEDTPKVKTYIPPKSSSAIGKAEESHGSQKIKSNETEVKMPITLQQISWQSGELIDSGGYGNVYEGTKKPTPVITEKAWHFDAESKVMLKMDNHTSYKLIPASAKDIEKVKQFYGHHPIPGMVIDEDSVQVIYNPNMNRGFALRMALLQERKDSAAFQPKWSEESQIPEQKAQRGEVEKLAANLAYPYRDSDYPAVKILPLWHGTKPSVLESILKTGYANLATTDSGYFGKGIYSAYEAEYAYRVYSQGTLILNWVAFYSAYPVIKGDMSKLEGKSNYQNYDAHFAPVVPANPNNPNEKVYFPCAPNQKHQCIEVVVFESSQCLPRYEVKIKAGLPVTPSNVLEPQKEKKEGKKEKIKQQNQTTVITPLYQPPVLEKKSSYSPQPIQIYKPSQPGEKAYQEGMKYFMASQYLKALPYFEEAAKHDYPTAYLRLGWLYAVGGRIGPKDEAKNQMWYQKVAQSFSWFEAQAEMGSAAAQYDLGMCYEYSQETMQNYTKAMKWYQKAADQGYAPAQCNLGDCYNYGRGTMQDNKEAMKWYQKAANQGYAMAQCSLGTCYECAPERDCTQARKWYSLAAEQGCAVAQNNLGVCYYHHWDFSPAKSYAEAVIWFQKAADQGVAAAQYGLGICYENGRGVKQDKAEALKWYQKAADQGLEPAKNGLKNFGEEPYQEGMKYFMASQYLKALPYFEKAAKDNYPAAYLRLAWLYEYGRETGFSDATKSQEWYEKVAQSTNWFISKAHMGDPDGQYNLAVCYDRGLGVKLDVTKAAEWYQKAASQGNPLGQNSLGDCCHDGRGVNCDFTKAAEWYQKAAQQGCVAAQYNLGACYDYGSGVEQNKTEAAKWYQKAADQGYKAAQVSLKKHRERSEYAKLPLFNDSHSKNPLSNNSNSFFSSSASENLSPQNIATDKKPSASKQDENKKVTFGDHLSVLLTKHYNQYTKGKGLSESEATTCFKKILSDMNKVNAQLNIASLTFQLEKSKFKETASKELAKHLISNLTQQYQGYTFPCNEIIQFIMEKTKTFITEKGQQLYPINLEGRGTGPTGPNAEYPEYQYLKASLLYCIAKGYSIFDKTGGIVPREEYTDSSSFFSKHEPLKAFKQLLKVLEEEEQKLKKLNFEKTIQHIPLKNFHLPAYS